MRHENDYCPAGSLTRGISSAAAHLTVSRRLFFFFLSFSAMKIENLLAALGRENRNNNNNNTHDCFFSVSLSDTFGLQLEIP
jgi:hypothetical protein